VPLTAGTRLGVYEIRGQLGAGGMGEVYLARDSRLARDVAVKILPPDFASDAERLARFEREARTVASLNHPGIVTLHAVEDAGGLRFLVMERVSGRTLDSVVGTCGLPIGRLLDLAAPLADALAAAHEKGVVHRDLKPTNVMVTDEGHVKILDFGLATAAAVTVPEGGDVATTLARSMPGQIMGTIPYMAPEQCRGERVDARADLFALGAMLYEMATGVRAFQGNSSADVMSAVLKDDPRPLDELKPELPARFTRIVSRCLEKDPRRRVQSAIDLKHELQDLADELRPAPQPAVAPGSPVATGAPGRPRATTWLLAAAGVAVVGLLAVGAIEFGPWRGGSTPTGGSQPIKSLAVLPFENRMHDASQDYFVEGIHDALITELVRLNAVPVTSRNAVMRFKGKTLAIRDIARELNVDAVIDGSVLRSGQSVRIDAKLVLGANDQNVWAKSYDRDLQDVLSLLRDVSAAIAGEVRARVSGAAAAPPAAAPVAMTPGASSGLPQPQRVRPEAYEAYLRGRYLFSQSLSSGQMAAAREQALLATRLDPGFGLAWSGLAATYTVDAIFGYGPRAPAVAMARDAARKALDLSPDEGIGLSAEGMLQLYFDWDFDAAGKKLERAVTLRPHEAMLRHGWADYLMVMGRYDESLEQTRLGRSSDPASPVAAMVAVFHAMAARRFDEVVGDGRRALLLRPGAASVHSMIGQALWQEEKYDEAVAELKLAAGEGNKNWRVFEDTFRRLGPHEALKAYSSVVAADLVKKGASPISVAEAFAFAGERDQAIGWLERAYAAREPGVLHIPGTLAFESLRQDPRFQDLLRRAGLRMPPLPAGSATRRP